MCILSSKNSINSKQITIKSIKFYNFVYTNLTNLINLNQTLVLLTITGFFFLREDIGSLIVALKLHFGY